MSRLNIWIVLLLISVLLNGVLLGAGARTWFGADTPDASSEPAPPTAGGFQLRRFVAALPEDERREARARIVETRRELGGLVREAGRSRRLAAEALLADPFDPDAAELALDRSRQARTQLEDATEALILDIAADLEPEERQAAFRAAMRLPASDRQGPSRERRRPPPGASPGG